MSHSSTSTKKSVFDRIGRNMSSSSTSSTTSVNVSSKSMHGFCNAFIKTGACVLGDQCKYIHEQPNLDKTSGSKEEIRITKTITRTVDMSSSSIKSTITVSNDQRPVIVSNSVPSSRTVVESVTSNDSSDRRLTSSDRKQSSQNHHSDSKSKSLSTSNNESSKSSKKKKSSSSHESRHSSNRKSRGRESESPVSSESNAEHLSPSTKRTKKIEQPMPSKYKRRTSKSPVRDDEETPNDPSNRSNQTSTKSPKRTIVLANSNEKRKEESSRRTSKDESKPKSKFEPEIEFLGTTKASREKKPVETIHQQAEYNKKPLEVKREKRSPHKTSNESQRSHSTSNSTTTTKPVERSDRRTGIDPPPSTPPVVRLSPTPPIIPTNETTNAQINSPPCVVLDDDSSPSPTRERKLSRQTPTTPVKKSTENEKTSSKSSKRSRETEKPRDEIDTKRKRTSESKSSSSNKLTSENRSTSSRSETHRSGNTSSRDDSSSRKHKDNSESKTSRTTSSTTKSRHNSDRREETSSERRRSLSHRIRPEKSLDNITDSDDHSEEPAVLKPTAAEIYSTMDWSLLSRDKRIPLNSQVTSRITRSKSNGQTLESLGIAQRLLTDEQKEKLIDRPCQTSPLTYSMRQFQQQSAGTILQSCQRRFGSCAKDMIEMRHKWFIRSVEPIQREEFMNKEHYVAFQQAINSLLNKTPSDAANLPIETSSNDVL